MPPHLHGAHATPPPEPLLCVQAASAWRSGLHPRRLGWPGALALAVIGACLAIPLWTLAILPPRDTIPITRITEAGR